MMILHHSPRLQSQGFSDHAELEVRAYSYNGKQRPRIIGNHIDDFTTSVFCHATRGDDPDDCRTSSDPRTTASTAFLPRERDDRNILASITPVAQQHHPQTYGSRRVIRIQYIPHKSNLSSILPSGTAHGEIPTAAKLNLQMHQPISLTTLTKRTISLKATTKNSKFEPEVFKSPRPQSSSSSTTSSKYEMGYDTHLALPMRLSRAWD